MNTKYGGFVIGDSSLCSGCEACVVACFEAHRKNRKGKTVGSVNTAVQARLFIVGEGDDCAAVQCRQCENAPCLAVCPSGAITRENDVIILNNKVCIGCKSCLITCPFGAIEASRSDGKATFIKCDCCAGNEKKACIQACPNHALSFVEPEAENRKKRIESVKAMLLP